ncbi:aminoacyltransferase [Sneathiella marina]|uniref:Aminoacyltransferase n=1 Tax=Sneathiella marina TaxID=2950108 RepID=A0ABY4W327_9PROT|nr:peptidoglycan bridge formation glycyltransferase FemA/FemB family protein [Sneathiella marina]USG61314.1 aminoacyltransferase [Sneathiella marina]
MNGLKLNFLNENEWKRHIAEFSDHNYRQFWSYGVESAARIGAKSEFVGIFNQEKLIGLTNVRLKKLPIFPLGIAYVNGGPIHVRDSNDAQAEQDFKLCLQALIAEYTRSRNFVLRIKCSVYTEEGNANRSIIFEDLGFRKINQSDQYRTFVVDIEKDTDEIRSSLNGKWRNQLNRAQKNDLTISTGTSGPWFQKFEDLFIQLKQKKGFDVSLGVDFYERVQEGLSGDDQFFIQIASKDDNVLAAHVGSYVGDTAVYLLGASTAEGNQLKASYLLQWNAIVEAKSRGCKWYDLGGIDPDGNKGVFHFKKGFNGDDVTAAGPYEIGNQVIIGLVKLAEKTYNSLKKSK